MALICGKKLIRLIHLKELTELESLYLDGTQVTDAGVAEL